MTSDTTSSGMPPIPAAHDALEMRPPAPPVVQSLLGEGKTQVASTLDGIADAVRDVAGKLEGSAGPLATYVHQAADTVAGWSRTVEDRSVDELLDDTRTLVRTSPAVAVALAVAAGFVVARLFRSAR